MSFLCSRTILSYKPILPNSLQPIYLQPSPYNQLTFAPFSANVLQTSVKEIVHGKCSFKERPTGWYSGACQPMGWKNRHEIGIQERQVKTPCSL
jgi:hypothetical protein